MSSRRRNIDLGRSPSFTPENGLRQWSLAFLVLVLVLVGVPTHARKCGAIDPGEIQACRHHRWVYYCRGGAGRGKDLVSGGTKANNLDNVGDNATEATSTHRRRTSWPFVRSLFDLSEKAKAEALASSEEDIVLSTNNRGGALVKSAPVRSSWFHSLTFSKQQVADTDVGLQKTRQNLERLWWNNAWTEQVLVIEETVEMIEQPTPLLEEESPDVEVSEPSSTLSWRSQRRRRQMKEPHGTSKPTKEQTYGQLSSKSLHEGSDTNLSLDNTTKSAMEGTNSSVDTSKTARNNKNINSRTDDNRTVATDDPTPYTSSGYWVYIDSIASLGYSKHYPSWRISRSLRSMRKVAANMTGLHGYLSGKGRQENLTQDLDEDQMGVVRRRLAAIQRARGNVARIEARQDNDRKTGLWQRLARGIYPLGREDEHDSVEAALRAKRMARLKEIDQMIVEGQQRLQKLVVEKDMLQHKPNPLWNYTTTLEDMEAAREKAASSNTTADIVPVRKFIFPSPELVEEYLHLLVSSGRLVRMNHTALLQSVGQRGINFDDDDDDDLLSPGVGFERPRYYDEKRFGSGSRWLRNGLGEKLGAVIETAAYKAVCTSVMSFLAKALSALHGINVMQHSDIMLSADHIPNLPPLAAGFIPGSGKDSRYAEEAFQDVMRRGARKGKRRGKRNTGSFLQRDAVVETLISQSQLAAPLLKVFPLSFQRALLSNIVTLITAILTDFCEGLEFEILGHRLSVAFTPISERDMLRRFETIGERNNHNPARLEEFETAIRATTEDLAEAFTFLDRWHERALGGALLRQQLAALVARIVLSLVDDILSKARMDLWTAHAGGPRLTAGLEFRSQQRRKPPIPQQPPDASSLADEHLKNQIDDSTPDYRAQVNVGMGQDI